MSMWARLGRLAASLFRLTVLVGLLAGVPYGLATQIGWPLPRSLPRSAEEVLPQVQQWLTTPVTDQVVLNLLAAAMWILWGSFTASVIVEVPSRLRGVVPRRVPVLAPMQSLAGWLLSGITIGVLAAGTLAASATPPAGAEAAPAVTLVVPEAGPPGGSVVSATVTGSGTPGTRGLDTASHTAAAADQSDQQADRLTHEVARGDWMWHIAGRYLGDEQRYPEIAQLNPSYADRYEDYPNHIEAGDQLVLPDDARDRGQRPHATGETLIASPAPDPPAAPPPPTPPEPPAPSPEPPATPAPDPSGQPATPNATPTSPAVDTPEPGAGPDEAPGDEADEGGSGDQPQEPATPPPGAGVSLPSGAWISIGLAALIAAVATVLRLYRRRRTRLSYPIEITTEPAASPVPDSLRPADVAGLRALDLNDDQDDSPLAGVMPAPPPTAAAVGLDEHGQAVSLFDLPGDGLCLHGAGALPAGRAILAAATSTGVSQAPGARPIVVTCVDTLAALLPPGVTPEGLDPHGKTFDGERLMVATDAGQAVTIAEEEMIARRRVLDELDAESMDAVNAREDHAEQQPPYLLLLREVGRHAARLRVLAGCRQALHMHMIILDQQLDDLPAMQVAADGAYTTPAGQPGWLSTLAAGDLAHVLDLVRQALPRPEPEPSEPATVPEPATVSEPGPAPASTYRRPPASSPRRCGCPCSARSGWKPTPGRSPPGSAAAPTRCSRCWPRTRKAAPWMKSSMTCNPKTA